MNIGIKTVGVIGAGAMGRGIAQLSCTAGFETLMFDIDHEAAIEATASVRSRIKRLIEKGKPINQNAGSKLRDVPNLSDLAKCDLVIEAIVENLEVKKLLFRDLELIVGSDTILATNTSSLSVTSIASALKRPERAAGLHFFNPPPLMKIVEVVRGIRTEKSVLERLHTFVNFFGHYAVQVEDTPGFLLNFIGRAYVTEAFRLLEDRIADYSVIDRIMRSAGFRMGPFELMDLTGLDVTHPATEQVYNGYYNDPRLRPSFIARNRVAGGLLGKKTTSGFYSDEEIEKFDSPKCSQAAPTIKFALVGDDETGLKSYEKMFNSFGLSKSVTKNLEEAEFILCAALGHDAASAAITFNIDQKKMFLLDFIASDSTLVTLVRGISVQAETVGLARCLLNSANIEVEVVQDSPGAIKQRIQSMVVNIACEAAQKGLASPEQIDRAIMLGLGYPKGPLQMGDEIGPRRILDCLNQMMKATGDPRYRPSLWLRRRAELGLSLTLMPLSQQPHN